MYLLLVDNNYISSKDIKGLLVNSNINCEVVSSSSWTSLLDLNKKIKPEILTVDLDFFSDDSATAVKKLRLENPNAFIIAFFDPNQYHQLNQALEEGIDDYLVKPLQGQDLIIRIKIGLRKKDMAAGALADIQDQSSDKDTQPGLPEIDISTTVDKAVEKDYSNIRYFSKTVEPKADSKLEPGWKKQEYNSSEIRDFLKDQPEIDGGEYRNLFEQAKVIAPYDPDEAVKIFERAFHYYRQNHSHLFTPDEGGLAENAGDHEEFIGYALELIELLKIRSAYAQIIRLCEKALEIEYYEEDIHMCLIEAMLAEGMTARARAHYDEVTSAFYREMGVKPSFNMKKLFEQEHVAAGALELDLGAIQNGLCSRELSDGALLCNTEEFRYSYKLEQLRCERNGQSVLLCLIMLIREDYTKPPDHILKKVMPTLQTVIIGSLRKGDLVTRWSDGQFLLLLPGLNREQATGVMERIEHLYLAQHTLQGLQLQKKVETLFPLEGDCHFN